MLTLGLLAGGNTQAALVFDSFNTGSLTTTAWGVSPPAFGTAEIGGNRTITSSGTGNGSVILNSSPATGVFGFSSDTSSAGSASITYGFSAYDFTQANTLNAFRIAIPSSDSNMAGSGLNNAISLTLGDGTNSILSTYTFTNTDSFNTSINGQTLYVDFLYSAFNPVNLSAVTSLIFSINGTVNDEWDVTFDQLSLVCSGLTTTGASSGQPSNGDCTPPPPPGLPEPATLFLMGAGLAGFAARRKLA